VVSEGERQLLIVDDDARFAETLATEFRDRNYRVANVASLDELRTLELSSFRFAIVDLRLRRDNGLEAVSHIADSSPHIRVVVLTGYGSIATAVQATKLGASEYLTKPIDFDELERALTSQESPVGDGPVADEFQSLDRHEREYIEFVLAKCGGNISQAARRLGLHRQSLQRKLRKYTPI
jgi:two-component system response regulator RegA